MLKEANDIYPSAMIERHFDLATGQEIQRDYGCDTMALFIGREIMSATYDGIGDKAARRNIAIAMEQAAMRIYRIAHHFRQLP